MACGVEFGRTPGAVEQGDAEFLLQALHLLADRRRRQVNRLRGIGEGAELGNGQQGLEPAQAHFPAAWYATPSPWSFETAAGRPRGRSKSKRAHLPGSLSTVIVPWCRRTMP